MGLYDRYLSLRVRRSDRSPPRTIAVVLTERDLLEQGAYERLEQLLTWAFDYGAHRILLYVSVLDDRVIPTLTRQLEELDTPRELAIRRPTDGEQSSAPIQASLGLGGKHEFTNAIQALAEQTDSGDLTAVEITEATLEEHLVFQHEPDLVIKTGAERLSDFLIWQSVYSELYFTDVNWRNLRKRDYLRALLDYLDRKRRYGR